MFTFDCFSFSWDSQPSDGAFLHLPWVFFRWLYLLVSCRRRLRPAHLCSCAPPHTHTHVSHISLVSDAPFPPPPPHPPTSLAGFEFKSRSFISPRWVIFSHLVSVLCLFPPSRLLVLPVFWVCSPQLYGSLIHFCFTVRFFWILSLSPAFFFSQSHFGLLYDYWNLVSGFHWGSAFVVLRCRRVFSTVT